MSPAERMAAIFVGNPKAHCVADFTQATTDEKTRKVKPKYITLNGPATLRDFDAHLKGDLCLLVIPVDQDGLCFFGVIDVDDYKIDEKKLAKLIKQHRLPLVMERSKSGGWHLVWYLRAAMLASAVRERLADFAATLGFTNVEIFPKQERLEGDEKGNGINLSFFAGDSGDTYAIDELGNRLSLAEWLDLIERMRDAPLPRAVTVSVELAGRILSEHWTEQRNELCLIALGTMLRAKLDAAEAQEIVDCAMQLAGDEEQGTGQRPTAARVARELVTNKKVPGEHKLRERIGDEATDQFLEAIGKPSKDRLPLTFALLPQEFLDTQPPAIEFTIETLLMRLIVALLIAEGATGKTNFMLRALMSIATGRPFFGMNVTAGRAIYLGLEDNLAALRRRVFWQWQREVLRMQQEKRSLEYIEHTRQSLLANLTVESAVGHELHLIRMHQGQVIQSPLIDQLIRRLPRPLEVLAMDPLSRLNGCEENSNAVGSALVNANERIAREVGCSVLIAHHTGKAASAARDESLYSARGASGFADAARSVMRLMVANADDVKGFANVDEGAVARGEILKLVHAKSNDAPRGEDLWLRRQGHDFDLWTPQSTSGGSLDRDLKALFEWWVKTGKKPFSKITVEELRGTIFGPGVSQARSRAAVAQGIHQEVITQSAELAPRTKHPLLSFREGYDPDAL